MKTFAGAFSGFPYCVVSFFLCVASWAYSPVVYASTVDGSQSAPPAQASILAAEGTDDGTILVNVATYPRGSDEEFVFTGDVSGTAYGDGDSLWQGGLAVPGTYQSTEQTPFGWHIRSIRCDDGDSYGYSPTATFNVDSGETVQCRFYNLEDGAGGCRGKLRAASLRKCGVRS